MRENAPGFVRAYDARTGRHKWDFHNVPQSADEYGADTWLNGAWRYSGNTNTWGNIAADPKLGYVYLPTSTPTSDYYGGHRVGDNLFAESLVCVDLETGERVWHFQMVHHGVWDYDNPTGPNLFDVVVDGRPIKAIAQVTKQGFVYAFDRVTGEPIWPIEERAVPTDTDLQGEVMSPTQPFPLRRTDWCRKRQADGSRSFGGHGRHLEAVAVNTRHAGGVDVGRLRERLAVEHHRVGVVVIHVRDDAGGGTGQRVRLGGVPVRRVDPGHPPVAADVADRFHFQLPEREVAEVHVIRGVRVRREKRGARHAVVALDLRAGTEQRHAPVRERVFGAALGHQERRPRVPLQVPGVLSHRAYQKHGVAIVEGNGDKGAVGVALRLGRQRAESAGLDLCYKSPRSFGVGRCRDVDVIQRLWRVAGRAGVGIVGHGQP